MSVEFPLSASSSSHLANLLGRMRGMASEPSLIDRQIESSERYRAALRSVSSPDLSTDTALAAWAVDVLDGLHAPTPTPVRGLAGVVARLHMSRATWLRPAGWVLAGGIAISATAVAWQAAADQYRAHQAEVAAQRAADMQARHLAAQEAYRRDRDAAAAAVAAWSVGVVAPDVQPLVAAERESAARLLADAPSSLPPEAQDYRPVLVQAVRRHELRAMAWLTVIAQAGSPSATVPAANVAAAQGVEAAVRHAIAAGDLDAAQRAVAQRLAFLVALESVAARPSMDGFDGEALAAMREAHGHTEQALRSGDGEAALAGLRLERDLDATIRQAYTLRIVDRPGAMSGVWLHPPARPDVRSYYLVVEAIGPGGAAIELPVESEETQRSRRVTTFAVRVPEAEYNRIRAQKEGSGRVTDPLIGEKQAGQLRPSYRIAVEGGAITEW